LKGTNLITHSTVAIKFETRKSDAPQLANEYRTYKILKGIPGIPAVHHFSQDPTYNILCMDLQGQNLESMFDLCHRSFSVKTVAMLAKRMITLIQSVHERNLIYRDIKPDNFITGKPARNSELKYALGLLSIPLIYY
jgi:casein kinase 1